ncbi:fatty acyl-CoA hydrolase precursor, medium chain-like [Ambystoma mexicanum]|uniref:fatty acyl-CoA hydrolase precursor, medium chain-like n=1 Tax=Ambystoma mexicanum TaxID=8296 RepID=UPI0037E82D40
MWPCDGPTIILFCLAVNVWRSSCASHGQEDSQLLVSTKYGQLQGKQLRVKGTDRAIDTFYGIPFAKPPIGELRYAPPEPADPWSGVREATAYPPMCLQDLTSMDLLKEVLQADIPTFSISEDCLYLNIYTPSDRRKGDKLPVMVWIHGGGLVNGGASIYDGSALTAYGNVIMVAIQYRLSVLGFFSTGDEHAPGNWGFLDQVAALQWVQENIESFGGDPDSVTIFGESAGGISVSALVLSPFSKGLFHKAISESGVALLPSIVCTDKSTLVAINHMIANSTGCETTDSAAMVRCMRQKTEEEILKPIIDVKIMMVPVVIDGVFFPKSPEEILTGMESNRVPYLIGFNNHEMGWIVPIAMNISKTDLTEGFNRELVMSLMPRIGALLGSRTEYLPLLIEEYLGDKEDPIQLRNSYLDMFGDILFVHPSFRTANFHRDAGLPVYFYEFQHRPSMFSGLKPDYVKADHGDEVGFVFGWTFLEGDIRFMGNVTEEEKKLSRTIMTYWANFARNGNPNGKGLPEWPVYDDNEQLLEISLEQKIGKHFQDQRMTLLDKILSEKSDVQKEQHTEL